MLKYMLGTSDLANMLNEPHYAKLACQIWIVDLKIHFYDCQEYKDSKNDYGYFVFTVLYQ